MKILVIEDGNSSYFLMVRDCIKLGIQSKDIHRAVRLEEAEKVLKEEPIDVIILDLGLPDSDEDSSIEFIQKHVSYKIIIYSGTEDKSTILKCMKLGVITFLSKQYFRMEDLERALVYARHR